MKESTKDKLLLLILIVLVVIASSLHGNREAEEDRQSKEVCTAKDYDDYRTTNN